MAFSQFKNKNDFGDLLKLGYQEIKDIEFTKYLKICTKQEFIISLEQAFYNSIEEDKRAI